MSSSQLRALVFAGVFALLGVGSLSAIVSWVVFFSYYDLKQMEAVLDGQEKRNQSSWGSTFTEKGVGAIEKPLTPGLRIVEIFPPPAGSCEPAYRAVSVEGSFTPRTHVIFVPWCGEYHYIEVEVETPEESTHSRFTPASKDAGGFSFLPPSKALLLLPQSCSPHRFGGKFFL